MSRIEELIEALCPDGVATVQLKDTCDFRNSRGKSDNQKYIYVGVEDLLQSKKGIKADPRTVNSVDGTVFLEGDILIGNIRPYLEKIWHADQEGRTNQDVLAIAIKSDSVVPLSSKFLFYILSSDKFFKYDVENSKGAKMPRGDKAAILKYSFQVPPIAIQLEIVDILDKFEKLQAELQAELQARKAQYEFYRESLFNEDTSFLAPLESIATIWRGRRFVKDDILPKGVPAIHYGEIYTKFGLAATEAYSFLDPSLAAKLRFASPGDVILVSAGETIEDIGKSFSWFGKEDVVIHDACYGIRSSEVDPRYMVHFFNTHNFRSQLRRYISSSKISAISTEKLGKVFIPVPPIKRQREVAEILDSYDDLVSDVIRGIPAEINARRQQYEHYRNKLLVFKELVAT